MKPFGTYALPLDGSGCSSVVLAVTIVPVLELAKWMVRRGWFGSVD